MGKIGNFVTSLIGGAAPKAKAEPIKASVATQDVAEAEGTAKAARAALYSTSGGVSGQELDPGQVKRRQTLLGN